MKTSVQKQQKQFESTRLVLLLTAILLIEFHMSLASAESFRSVFTMLGQPKLGQTEVSTEGLYTTIFDYPSISTTHEFTEAVLSWNVEAPETVHFQFYLQPSITSHFYNMGRWTRSHTDGFRRSITGQTSEAGKVDTDTLVLAQPANAFRVRVEIESKTPAKPEWIKLLGIITTSVVKDTASSPTVKTPSEAEVEDKTKNITLEVPAISQLSFADGKAWCSPTSLTMVLNYWGNRLNRDDLKIHVPETAKGVYDPGWGGTGNWSFNSAFAGSFPGMRAFVTRLESVNDIRHLVNAGVPVIASVSYNRLKGLDKNGSGHLVVCVGFDSLGKIVINDPGVTENVRRSFPIETFNRAWIESKNTVYLLHPANIQLPTSNRHQWP